MKRLILIGALATGLACSTEAEAHPVRECGGYGYTESGKGPYFLPTREIYGAGIYNITSRAVTCHTARKLARRVQGHCSRATCRVGTFTCRTKQVGTELNDTRCTSSRSRHYVVHWQFGA